MSQSFSRFSWCTAHSAVMLAEAGAPDRPCISSSGGRAGRRASVAVPRQMSATIPTRHNPNVCHNPNFTDNARPLLSATVLQQHSAGQLWWRGREERTGTSKPNMVKKKVSQSAKRIRRDRAGLAARRERARSGHGALPRLSRLVRLKGD